MTEDSYQGLSKELLVQLYGDCSENVRMYSTARRQGLQVFYSVVVALFGGILLGPGGATQSLLGLVGIVVSVAAWLEERRWNELQYYFMNSAIEIEEHLEVELYAANPATRYKSDPLSAYAVGQVMFGIIFLGFIGAIIVGIG